MNPPLLRLDGVCVHFAVSNGLGRSTPLQAVRNVSFELTSGSALALVGESGCGKSTLGRAILRLAPLSGGRILFEGANLATATTAQLLAFRRDAQMVFQDPMSSLNPRLCIEDIVAEGLDAHRLTPEPAVRRARVAELLQQVGLSPEHARRFPHEFSGGQRQRIAIARALAVGPRLLICDEPTSALDVSIRGQILNLLSELRRRLGLTLIMITHDLAVARRLCEQIAVMYAGQFVEQGRTQDIFEAPAHPYSEALLRAAPSIDPAARRGRGLTLGEPPSPLRLPDGCTFHPRCPKQVDRCRRVAPELVEVSARGGRRRVACPVVAEAFGREDEEATRSAPGAQ